MMTGTCLHYTELDRWRELVIHAKDGSPIAVETVRSFLRAELSDASPDTLLALAERLMEVKDEWDY